MGEGRGDEEAINNQAQFRRMEESRQHLETSVTFGLRFSLNRGEY
jgi:hypothetical protein